MTFLIIKFEPGVNKVKKIKGAAEDWSPGIFSLKLNKFFCPFNVIKFVWASSHYWVIGDEFGYFICNTGLNDHGTYVGYDTTYVDWFGGSEVPIINGSSYSREDGEVNVMIAPVKTMVGDTTTIYYGYFDNWREEETYGSFYVIFD